MNIDLLTIGDCAIDLHMKVAEGEAAEDKDTEHPKICFYHGSKIPVEHFETSIAGNSVNVALGCRNLGLKTAVYTELGDDENADRVILELKNLGIDNTLCKKNKGGQTNVHTVIVYGGERTIFSYHEKCNYKIQKWGNPSIIYYTSMGEGFETFQHELVMYLKQNREIVVGFNPGSIQMKAGVDSLKDILEFTHILFVNKEEAIKLSGKNTYSIREMHSTLQKLGPKLTVITDGQNGASAFDGKDFIQHGVYSDKRPVIDKTGAGDAFASGFLSAIFYKKPLKEALLWGIVNSGCAIKVIGATKGVQTKEGMEKIVKNLL